MNKVGKPNHFSGGASSMPNKHPHAPSQQQSDLQASHLRAIIEDNFQPIHTADVREKSSALGSQIQIPMAVKRQGTG